MIKLCFFVGVVVICGAIGAFVGGGPGGFVGGIVGAIFGAYILGKAS